MRKNDKNLFNIEDLRAVTFSKDGDGPNLVNLESYCKRIKSILSRMHPSEKPSLTKFYEMVRDQLKDSKCFMI